MSNRISPLSTFGALKETMKYYLEKRLDKATLGMAEQSSQITSSLITSLALMSLAMIFYVFIMLTIGLFLGAYMGSYAMGFAVVSIFVALTIAGIYVFRNRLITTPVVDQILTQVNFEHVNNMADLKKEDQRLELQEKMAEEMMMAEMSKLPNQAFSQLLDKHLMSSQLASMTAYGIQVAANRFAAEQSEKPAYQDWWRPFMPILIDFASDYLKDYLSSLKLDTRAQATAYSNNTPVSTNRPTVSPEHETQAVPQNNVPITELVEN